MYSVDHNDIFDHMYCTETVNYITLKYLSKVVLNCKKAL